MKIKKVKSNKYQFQCFLLLITWLITACSPQKTDNLSAPANLPPNTSTPTLFSPASAPPTLVSVPLPATKPAPSDKPTTVSLLPTSSQSFINATATALSPSTASLLNSPGPPVILYYAFDGHMYRTDIAGEKKEQLTITPETDPDNENIDVALTLYRPPQLSPDGRWLILNHGNGKWTLLDLSTGVEAAQGQGQPLLSPTWSPDSQQFAYLANNQLCLYDLIDKADTCSFTLPQNGKLTGVLWSPVGAQAVVTLAKEQSGENPLGVNGEIWLVNMQDGKAENIGAFSAGFESPITNVVNWLPDGSGLIINTAANSSSILFRIANNSKTSFPYPVIDVSPDGRYFLHSPSYITGIDGGNSFFLPNNCESGEFELTSWAWAFDAKRLAYLTACQGTNQQTKAAKDIFVVNIPDQTVLWQREISPQLSIKAWTPDDNYLLLHHKTSGWPQDTAIWRIPANGDNVSKVIVPQGIYLNVVPQWEYVQEK